jgi:hypothetical protein
VNLDAVTAELRPRGLWEAVDFGARLVRRDAAIIYRVWFAVTLPLLALATLATVYLPYPGWIQTAYWWLEPLADGPILYIISRRLFGRETTVATALRATPGLARRNWIFLSTPYRLHFARSLAMPLTQLEGLVGKKRRERAKVLNQSTFNHGIGVTMAYQHLALCLVFGVYLLGMMFVPPNYYDSLGESWLSNFYSPQGSSGALVTLYVFYIAQSALQPWFVGAGFGLYINCRTILEAWDIEVAFRRMLQRRATKSTAAVAAVLMLLVLSHDPAVAEEAPITPWWDEMAIDAATKTTYENDALHTYHTVEVWKSTAEPDEEEAPPSADFSGLKAFFEALRTIFAVIVEFGLWIAVGIIVLLVAANAKRWLPTLRRQPRRRGQRRSIMLSSGELMVESLPDDIPGAAKALWHAGERREALSLLYRGGVFAVVDQHGVRLPDSATEGACVRAVNEQSTAPVADFFSAIVAAWVRCAYGRQQPADAAVSALCQDWPKHFGSPT